MKKLLMWAMVFGLLTSFNIIASAIDSGQMVSSTFIVNNPDKEKLCISRIQDLQAKAGFPKGKIVPFLIDSGRAAWIRQQDPDEILVAIDDGESIVKLITCSLNSKTGQYGPISIETASSIVKWWQPIRPKNLLETQEGKEKAGSVCSEAAKSKVNQEGFNSWSWNGNPKEVYEPNLYDSIEEKKAERYDVLVKGTLLYNIPEQTDLNRVEVSCLLSPTLDVKAVQVRNLGPLTKKLKKEGKLD
jgi:hypothetical protein